MNAHTYHQRVNFLGLKSKTLGLTADEQAELDRLRSIRVTEVSGGVTLIEAHPMDLAAWKAAVQRSRGAPTTLLADKEH